MGFFYHVQRQGVSKTNRLSFNENIRRQVFFTYQPGFTKNYSAFDDIAKFTYIARPQLGFERKHGIITNAINIFVVL